MELSENYSIFLARPAGGHAVADPATTLIMKSRRRIAFSKADNRINVGLRHSQSNQEIAIGKIESLVSLRSSNPEPSMSPSGAKCEILAKSR